MKSYKTAIVKFNNGNGALLCNACHIIIVEGYDHEDKYHYCDKCMTILESQYEMSKKCTH